MAPEFMLKSRLRALATRAKASIIFRARAAIARLKPQLLAEGSPWFDLLYVASPAEMLLFGEERAEGLSALSSSGDERRDVYSRLVSRRFQIDVAEPALERLLQAPVGVPSREVLRWTRTVFGVTAHPGESRLALLARVLESTSLAADLDSTDLGRVDELDSQIT